MRAATTHRGFIVVHRAPVPLLIHTDMLQNPLGYVLPLPDPRAGHTRCLNDPRRLVGLENPHLLRLPFFSSLSILKFTPTTNTAALVLSTTTITTTTSATVPPFLP
jgi:hypothetical protein